MANFGRIKISKCQAPDKTPYTVYYPHAKPPSARNWNEGYYQVASIDPARKNYALRIERRYHNGVIVPIVFDKTDIDSSVQNDAATICSTYTNLTTFLDKYEEQYRECHFLIVERQLPQNYKASRIAQHTISHFLLRLANTDLLPVIIELDPKMKGKILGAPKNISDKQLKSWAVEMARNLLTQRNDKFSLDVLTYFAKKQDDLSDTVCQIEALFIAWGLSYTNVVGTVVGPSEMVPPMINLKLLPTNRPVAQPVVSYPGTPYPIARLVVE